MGVPISTEMSRCAEDEPEVNFTALHDDGPSRAM